MPIENDPIDKDAHWLTRHATLVLLGCLLVSLSAWWHAAHKVQAESDRRFAQEVADLSTHLAQQVDHHIDVLVSFRAMFLVSEHIGRETFHQHHLDLQTQEEYPALQAVQYAPLVREADRAAFEARVRADHSLSPGGYPQFRVHPLTPGQSETAPITYNEPMERNQRVFGYDLLSDPARQASLTKARDTGLVQASAPLHLIDAGPDDKGFVVRMPVYRRGVALVNAQSRRDAFLGVVVGVVKANALMTEVTGQKDWRQLRWTVSDGGPLDQPAPTESTLSTPAADTLLFDSTGLVSDAYAGPSVRQRVDPEDTASQTLPIGGRRWQLTFTRPPVRPFLQPYPLALLLGGIMGALGLWWALHNAGERHAQASAMARNMSQHARDSEHRLRSVMDHTIDGIVSIAPSGRVLSANQAVCRIFGKDESEIVGHHLNGLLPEAGLHEVGRRVEAFLQRQCVGMEGLGHRTEGLRANGQRFPLDLAVSSMTLHGRKQYIAILRDLSTQETAERAIMEAHRQLNEVDEMRRVIVHNAPYAICVLNLQGVIQTINPAGERLLGHSAMELVGRSTAERFFDPDQIAERGRMLALRLNRPVGEVSVLAHMAQDGPGLPTEWNLMRPDGRVVVAELSVTELRNEFEQLTGYLVMAHDVTQRREAETQVQHMALHDALTALPNRNMLQEQLKVCLGHAEREGLTMAMMFIDLDRFKKINDSLGHHIGDNVLIEVARRLRAAMRTSDIVARLGGDEFVILLPRIAAEADGLRVAQKVLDEFAEPLRVGPHELRVTPSIGLALYPQHGQDAITLMRHADLAMYQAKNAGRNRLQVYSTQMNSPTAESLILENDLYKALERQELRLHYQPQFDCQDGRITGAEALLRWEHEGKLVSPADFIPLAEETGLIVPMGEWVLREACTQAQQWRTRSGWPLRIAVNLSAVQLEQPDIVDMVARALHDTGLPPTALELEITESVVVRESLRAAAILHELRALGVGIAIDDFGVGYSSFAYLRELPVNRFKLDRSFLAAVPQSSGDSRLAAALIAMAHRLEVGIVAEGVETAEQAAFLRDHQCDEAQGFYLGRPMKDAAFETMLMGHIREHTPSLSSTLPPSVAAFLS